MQVQNTQSMTRSPDAPSTTKGGSGDSATGFPNVLSLLKGAAPAPSRPSESSKPRTPDAGGAVDDSIDDDATDKIAIDVVETSSRETTAQGTLHLLKEVGPQSPGWAAPEKAFASAEATGAAGTTTDAPPASAKPVEAAAATGLSDQTPHPTVESSVPEARASEVAAPTQLTSIPQAEAAPTDMVAAVTATTGSDAARSVTTGSPVAEAASPTAPAVDPTAVVDQIRLAMRPGRSQVTIHLEPAHLGRVEVQLTLTRGRMTGHLVAESRQVARILETDMRGLFLAMEESGVRVDDFQISARDENETSTSPGDREQATRTRRQQENNLGDHAEETEERLNERDSTSDLQLLDLTI